MCLVCFSSQIKAQIDNLVVLEYSFIPKTKSEDQYSKYKIALNYPLKINQENSGYLFFGTEFNSVSLKLKDNYPFKNEMFKSLSIIDLKLGYSFRMKKNEWRTSFLFSPRIASTLNVGLTMDDVFLNGAILFTRSRSAKKGFEKPSTLVLGIAYYATFGVPFPIPIIRYSREINEHWSYAIGVPSSNFKYSFNTKNSLKFGLNFDGYFANIQKPLIVNGETVNTISLSATVLSLGYEYSFTKHLSFYLTNGFTVKLNNVLRNKDRDKVFTLDNVNSYYLKTGIKFKL